MFDDAKWHALEHELRAAFLDLELDDIGMAIRVKRPLAVDLIRASSGPLFREALADGLREGQWVIPSVEQLIVLKFLALTSHYRARARKIQDTADLCAMYERHRESLDRPRMIELSKLVNRSAEVEFQELLDKIDRGLPITI